MIGPVFSNLENSFDICNRKFLDILGLDFYNTCCENICVFTPEKPGGCTGFDGGLETLEAIRGAGPRHQSVT